jgi:hypothetical protein
VNYIVAANGGMYCFYNKSGGLFWREKLGENWSEPKIFRQDGLVNFTVSLCEGKILVLCQSANKVERFLFYNGNFENGVLVEGGLEGRYYGLALEDDTFLVHNIPVNGQNSQILMSHRITPGGLWTDSRHLGRIIPLGPNNPYEIVPVANQHFLLFYQAQGGNYSGDLGYREVFGHMMGDFNIIHPNSGISGSYHSFLATKYAVHMVYMTKGLLAPALVYRRKDSAGLGAKITVATGQNVHNPLLYMEGGRLNLLFMRGDELFSCNFNDSGDAPNISPPKNMGINTANLTRSRFLCENRSEISFFANELPVSREKPWEIRVLDVREERPEARVSGAVQIGSQEEYDSFFDEL